MIVRSSISRITLTEGKADVKVVALPMNIMEMLMDEDSEFETDDEDDDTVKMILKFGKGQELISAKSQSELSRMLASLHVSLSSTTPRFSTCSGVWKIYEDDRQSFWQYCCACMQYCT